MQESDHYRYARSLNQRSVPSDLIFHGSSRTRLQYPAHVTALSTFGLRTSDSFPWRCENPFRSRRLGQPELRGPPVRRLDSPVRANDVNTETWGRQTVRILMNHYTSLKGAVSVRNRAVIDWHPHPGSMAIWRSSKVGIVDAGAILGIEVYESTS
jgi:hypothetical protein